jgi:hypothetical protein
MQNEKCKVGLRLRGWCRETCWLRGGLGKSTGGASGTLRANSSATAVSRSGEAELGGAVGFGGDLGLLFGQDAFDVAMAGHTATAGAAGLGDAADSLGVGDRDGLADLPFGDTEAPAEVLRLSVVEAELHGRDQQGGGGQVIETESQVQ